MKSIFMMSLSLVLLLNAPVHAQTSAVPGALVGQATSASVVGSPNRSSSIPGAGIAAGVRGLVEAQQPGDAKRVLKSGDSIFVNDTITTGEESGLQILFRDETSFTIGAHGEVTIDEFIYDPLSHDGKVTTRVAQGVFRFISGAIAKKNPKNMNVHLPGEATLGVRGTIAAGETNGDITKVILMGPGRNNNTGDKVGSVIVGNKVGGQMRSVLLNRNGFATKIDGAGSIPSTPYLMPASELKGLTSALGAPADKQQSEASVAGPGDAKPSATKQAGQDTFVVAKELSAAKGTKAVARKLSMQADRASLDKVRSTGGGLGHLSAHNVSFDSGGTYNLNVNVDFNNRTIGGLGSSVSGTATKVDPDPFLFNLPKIGFPKGGDAQFQNIADSHPLGLCASCTADVNLHAFKDNPTVGSLIQNTVTVTNGSQTDSGSSVNKIEPGLF